MTDSDEATLATLPPAGSKTTAPPRGRPYTLVPGTTVGRFVVQERLGAGGMGTVHAALDPRLQRRVAIKVMHAGRDTELGRRAQRRLQREARAMASLSHPSVLTVHDVGVHEGHVFIAMELVRGGSLRAWARGPHSWETRLRVLLSAGEGLQAAHRAGVIHRDFKPENATAHFFGP